MKRILTLFIIFLIIVGVAAAIALNYGNEGPGGDPGQDENPLPKPPEKGTVPLVVNWVGIFEARDDSGGINIGAEISNPNQEWGVEDMRYEFKLMDGLGNEIGSVDGYSYIMPGEEKHIVFLNKKVQEKVAGVEIGIEDVKWKKLQDFVRLKLDAENPRVEEVDDDPKFKTRAIARIANNSFFGINNIEVTAVLFDSGNNPIDVSRTSIQTVLEGEKRDAEMFWPYSIPVDEVARLEIKAYSDVFENRNFLKQYE